MSMTITTGDDRDDSDLEDQVQDRDDDRDTDGPEPRDRSRQRDDDHDDDQGDDDEDKSPEELKAEIRRLRSSLSKANSSGNRRRQQLKELRNKVAALDDVEDDDSSDDDGDGEAPKPRQRQGVDQRSLERTVSKAVKRRERELEEQHRRDIIDTRAESALVRVGVSEKNIRLLKRELDYDELELLKDRSVDGLEEEVDRLRSEYPDFFRRGKTGGRRINGGDDREAGKRPKPMTASERQAAALRGRG